MKRVILILILVSLLLPIRTGEGEARELDWTVKEFLSLPALSDEVANIEPNQDDQEKLQTRRSTKVKKTKQSANQKTPSEPVMSGSDLCQSGGIRIGEVATASGEAGTGTCGILPSEQMLSTWSEPTAGERSLGVGGLSFYALWQGAPYSGRPIMALAPIDCAAGGISSVRANVYSASGTL
ncbi:MAG TPA: hypothetical protein VIX18_08755, partial [Nitrospirota bacterium]